MSSKDMINTEENKEKENTEKETNTEENIEKPLQNLSLYNVDNDKLFRVIADFLFFLRELNKNNKPIQLYARLIEKIKHIHTDSINKHCDIFRKFCVNNKDGILDKNLSKFSSEKICYNDRIFIDLNLSLRNANTNLRKKNFWIHLIKILAYVNPASGAKNILKEMVLNNIKNGDNKNDKMISELMTMVEDKVDPNCQDPMSAINGIMSGGGMKDILENITGKMGSGELDINGIFSSLQNMMGNLDQSDPTTQMFSGLINNLGGQLSQVQEAEEVD